MRANHLVSVLVAASLVGAFSPEVGATGRVKVTFTTTPTAAGGQFAPKNVVAVWIENAGAVFQRTFGRWADIRKVNLEAWIAKAGPNDTDAISGATRLDSALPLTAEWYLRDRQGQIVPDGTYTIKMELADDNAGTGTPNLGTFTFVKGPAPRIQTAQANGGFTNVTIDFDPAALECGNGAMDPNETCDPMVTTGPGACVASCAASADACLPNNLVGTAAACTAECKVEAITACVNADGCCAAGCDATTDDDCDPETPGTGGADVTGGCTTSGGEGFALAALGFLLVLGRRRRR